MFLVYYTSKIRFQMLTTHTLLQRVLQTLAALQGCRSVSCLLTASSWELRLMGNDASASYGEASGKRTDPSKAPRRRRQKKKIVLCVKAEQQCSFQNGCRLEVGERCRDCMGNV